MVRGDGEGGRYEGLSREQMIALLEKRDRQKKLGLVWERDEIEADRALEAEFVAADLLVNRSDPAGGAPAAGPTLSSRATTTTRCVGFA